jgi:hypothetical protein
MSATSSLRFERDPTAASFFFVSLQLIVVVVVVIISLVLCFLGALVCIGTTSVFFFPSSLCRSQSGDDPQQEDFVNCGYKLNITLKFKI